MMMEEGRPLSELARGALERVPQILQNASFKLRLPLEQMAAMRGEVERFEQELGERGRVLVRWSGTEAKLRVMVEGEDESRIRVIAEAIVAAATTDIAGAERG
jgi:phosphoglucosamine mutase